MTDNEEQGRGLENVEIKNEINKVTEDEAYSTQRLWMVFTKGIPLFVGYSVLKYAKLVLNKHSNTMLTPS